MKKFIQIIILILLNNFNIISQNLLSVETFYDSEREVITGKKRYFYNERNNIISIYSYNGDDELESKIIYNYDVDKLISGEEYIDEKSKIKHFVFIYDNKNTLLRKIEYNKTNKLMLIQNYKYDKNNNISSIEFIDGEGKFTGKKEFIYKNNFIYEENQYDENNKLLIKKKYNVNNNNIIDIEFYLANGKLIRIVERSYYNIKSKISPLGLRDNFFDFR